MKEIIFVPEDYVSVSLVWSEDCKIKKRVALVHKELIHDSCSMNNLIILGFCDKDSGKFSIMDVD